MNIKAISIFSITMIGLLFLIILFAPKSKPNVRFHTDERITTPIISKDDPSLGPKDAPVTIVHYGYIGCEYCKNTQQDLLEIRVLFPDEVRIIWKDFPNESLSPSSYESAIAGRCADSQNKFWEYQPFLFDYARELDENMYHAIAESAGLKKRRFARCLNKQLTAEVVDANIQEAQRLRVTATPTIFINETRITGQTSFWNIQELIIETLKGI